MPCVDIPNTPFGDLQKRRNFAKFVIEPVNPSQIHHQQLAHPVNLASHSHSTRFRYFQLSYIWIMALNS